MRYTREIRTADETDAFEHRRVCFTRAGVAKRVKVRANRHERRENRRNLRLDRVA